MSRRISYKSYRREFLVPLRTARGSWSVREGFIVRIETAGQVGFGEVAPIPEFGTETVAQARRFLDAIVVEPSLAVPEELPCCGFGVSAAAFDASAGGAHRNQIAALLPAGAEALSVVAAKAARGDTVFKWKIGVEPIETEMGVFRHLLARLPSCGRLRLDANGGLKPAEMKRWLAVLSEFRGKIEYLEQPLAVGQELAMAEVARASGIPIALDESLNGRSGAHWLDAWEGPLVIKPLLMGDINALIRRLQPLAARLILSSVFETGVGLENVRVLAGALPELNYATGFDTVDAFGDALGLAPELIWKQLPHSI